MLSAGGCQREYAMYVLNVNDSTPLYKQLYQQIRAHILSGKLPAHSRLPSVRDLAAELATSRNTVAGAYQELYAEGYIYSRQRSGYYASELSHDLGSQAQVPISRGELSPPEPPPAFAVDFHPARLDPASFPAAQWRTCFLEVLRENAAELTRYGDLQGDWELRCCIRKYLERSRGVSCTPEQIVVCAGLQESLEIVAHLLQAKHAAVAVENPGYHLPRAVFRNNSFTIVPIPVRADGIDLDLLRASDCTLAYVTPSHQLPLGCVMPIANRLNLIDWAQAGEKLILEDDYDSELRYHGKPIPSLQGLRPDGNILYTGTFSKILSPALRLSYMVLPPALLGRFRELYRDYFSSVSLLEQKTMARFMAQGYWERHVRRVRIRYQRKHDLLLKAIQHHFGERVVITGQGAGLHVVLQLRESNSGEAEILRRAEGEGIRLFPFSATWAAGEPAATSLMLGFGGLQPAEIEPGIEQLGKLCF